MEGVPRRAAGVPMPFPLAIKESRREGWKERGEGVEGGGRGGGGGGGGAQAGRRERGVGRSFFTYYLAEGPRRTHPRSAMQADPLQGPHSFSEDARTLRADVPKHQRPSACGW